jgi:hypothetical protein
MFGKKTTVPIIKWSIIVGFKDGSKLSTEVKDQEEADKGVTDLKRQTLEGKQFLSINSIVVNTNEVKCIFAQSIKEAK